MATQVLMPKLGLTMTEGTIEEWKFNEGDAVHAGDVLFSVATDKLTNDIEAETDGILLKILLGEGETAECKTVIAWIGEAEEEIPDASDEKAEQPAEERKTVPADTARSKNSADTKKKIVIIGGGPGGYIAAIRAAQLGADVTVIEKEKLGGTCLNIGCIPTKALLHSAELIEEIKNRGSRIGIEATDVKINFDQIMKHKEEVSSRLVNGVAGLFAANGIKTVSGTAKFTGATAIEVVKTDGTAETMTADAFIIASGSVNAVPPIPGIKDGPDCLDSTGVLSLKELPESMIVIGGGVIGMELACAYQAFGTKVTVVEALAQMLPMLDSDLTAVGVAHMKNMGVEFYTESPVKAVANTGEGVKVICDTKDGGEMELEAQKVLVAVGRRANTDSLDLAAAGINNDRGRIIVNDKMETNVPGVYAIGDCVMGRAQLAHTASAMGEVAAENIMGIDSAYDESTNPTCVYMEPEAASVGLTEAAAIEKGIDYVVGKFPMAANGKAIISNDGEGLVKIIADAKYGEVLGMHIIGPRATDMIGEGALAIRLEATLDELTDTIHSHPTVSEAVREAALDACGRVLNMPPSK